MVTIHLGGRTSYQKGYADGRAFAAERRTNEETREQSEEVRRGNCGELFLFLFLPFLSFFAWISQ